MWANLVGTYPTDAVGLLGMIFPTVLHHVFLVAEVFDSFKK